MIIRSATASDAESLWAIIGPVIHAGETYALPSGWSREDALAYWFSPDHAVFVAEDEGRVLGTYYLHANQRGGGSHVANCGYMVDAQASGRGVASAMARHSLEQARSAGFTAMQFNFVVSSNMRAIALWQRLGFEIRGSLPGAFHHPTMGMIDALVMHRQL